MINPGIMSSNTPEWATPQWLFNVLDRVYHFTLDPCSTHENAKCRKHYTREEDGLSQSWAGETVFMNPPYGREIGKWVGKCYADSVSGIGRTVALLPARTDTRWFHDCVYEWARIYFIRGRLKFGDGRGSAPFLSMIAVWNGSDGEYKEMVTLFAGSDNYEGAGKDFQWR
jgi:site-specific DNA-methyltransferase (adenine-specific)